MAEVLTLNYIADQDGCCLAVTFELVLCKVASDLEREQVACELILQLGGVRGVELDTEPEHQVTRGQTQLSAHRPLHVQPYLPECYWSGPRLVYNI